MFRIAFARGKAKKFVSIFEDDFIDLVDDRAVETEVMANIHDAIRHLSAGR